MKNKMNLLFVLAALLLLTGSSASAQQAASTKPEKANEAQTAKNVKSNAVKTDAVNEASTNTDQQAPKEKKPAKVKFGGESHRSMVASFVQSLLAVADREGGIGQEVKTIAQKQNEMKDRTADIINAVEGRSKIKTFLIGTSYKNLGELRSQMAITKNQIDQLKALVQKAENDQDKAELTTQIQTLENQQANIDNFIIKNEDKFSLFGWAVKLFRK